MQTNLISKEIQDLNRTSMHAAIEAVQAAKATSRFTKSNVLVRFEFVSLSY
jgi:hypothetical protein